LLCPVPAETDADGTISIYIGRFSSRRQREGREH
jgi:hypothetical protein